MEKEINSVNDKKEEESTQSELVSSLIKEDEEKKEEKTKKKLLIHDDENKIFRPFKIKDIVFLAIMAAATLLTAAIMPLVTAIPVFGIIQLCIGLQFSIFPAIGLMKVRKIGSLTLMSLFTGIFLVFMFWPMFICILVCAIISEALVLLFFRGYKRNVACCVGAALYLPLSLPFLYVFYMLFYDVVYSGESEVSAAIQAFVNPTNPWVAIGISFAVLAVCALGAFIGTIISHELRKHGVMKK